MKYTIKVTYMEKEFISLVEEGENLLEHLRGLDVPIDSPCGGNGTCGKCRVRVNSPVPMSDKEAKLLGHKAVEKGYRLACYQKVYSDLEVGIDENSSKGVIMTSVHDINTIANPDIEIKHITIDKPTLRDQRGYLDRVLDASVTELENLDLDLMFKINHMISNERYRVTTVSIDEVLLDVAEGWIEKIYSLAIDIGTTTVAVYLVDTVGSRIVDVESFYNPQKRFGADVISRIDYVNKTKNLKVLNSILIEDLNDAVDRLCDRNRISPDLIYSAFFAGNTTMMHLLLLLDPRNIANAPFIPQSTKAHRANAIDFGIEINRKGIIFSLPMVSAYIGADTTAAILSSGMYKNSEISMLLDLGTNGEIVLGNNEFLVSCSAAAGPAFEGANIRNGMAGIPGAIDKIVIKNGKVDITTIDSKSPKGLCGSAIIDAVAELLRAGILDETGRFIDIEDLETDSADIIDRRIKIDGQEAFLIFGNKESDELIAVTQKDIREVQNAKAAIAAGMKVLISEKGLKTDDIKTVYLAGGFGSFVNVRSAATIGLIPRTLEDEVVSVGNAAGAGAVLCAISCELYKKSIELADSVEYVELSSNPKFTGHFMEEMIFE